MLAAGDGRGGIAHLGCPQGAKAHSSGNREVLNEITPMIEGLWQHIAGCFAPPELVPPLSCFPRTVPWSPTAWSGRGRGDMGEHQVNLPKGDRESPGTLVGLGLPAERRFPPQLFLLRSLNIPSCGSNHTCLGVCVPY